MLCMVVTRPLAARKVERMLLLVVVLAYPCELIQSCRCNTWMYSNFYRDREVFFLDFIFFLYSSFASFILCTLIYWRSSTYFITNFSMHFNRLKLCIRTTCSVCRKIFISLVVEKLQLAGCRLQVAGCIAASEQCVLHNAYSKQSLVVNSDTKGQNKLVAMLGTELVN